MLNPTKGLHDLSKQIHAAVATTRRYGPACLIFTLLLFSWLFGAFSSPEGTKAEEGSMPSPKGESSISSRASPSSPSESSSSGGGMATGRREPLANPGETKVGFRTLTLASSGKKLRMYARQTDGGGRGNSSIADVLLLHGAVFSSKTWSDLGTLTAIADAGGRAVAIDLPGFGRTPASGKLSANERGELVAAAAAEFGLSQPLLVAPSMSGTYALPLLRDRPLTVGGFLPVAPGGVEEFASSVKASLSALSRPMPAVVLYGSLDTSRLDDADVLLKVLGKGAEKVIFEGAGHPAYIKFPERWNELLLGLARKVRIAGA